MTPRQSKSSIFFGQPAAGQIVVEYVLLLVVSVSMAVLITTVMVSRSPESPGFLTEQWQKIISTIGSDPAD